VDGYTTHPAIKLPLAAATGEFTRAEIVFYGVEHRGPSFAGRVYLNSLAADVGTPRQIEEGYAGSFAVFGHGGCFGDEGHCKLPSEPRDPFDSRPPHGLIPQTLPVDVTEALKRVDGEELTVTVIPVVRGQTDDEDEFVRADVLFFTELRLLTYL
jgi:hypothetical protein